MRLLVCGDRYWKDYKAIAERMAELSPDVVIEGEAKGADSFARIAAESMNITVLKFPASWNEYRLKYPISEYGMKFKSAGTDRNQQMLDEGKPDYVLAFHDDIRHSKGTADMVRRATEAGIPVEIWTHE